MRGLCKKFHLFANMQDVELSYPRLCELVVSLWRIFERLNGLYFWPTPVGT